MSLSGEKEIVLEEKKSAFYSNKHFSKLFKSAGEAIKEHKAYSLLFIMVLFTGVGELLEVKFSIGWWILVVLVVINNIYDCLPRKNDEKSV